MFEKSTDFYQIVVEKSQEIRYGIGNGTIVAQPHWDLDADFDAWIAPFYLSVLTINGAVSLLMHFLVFWLIWKKTPKEMRDYRYFLLNTAVISFIHDVQLTVYWRPVPFFPIPGAFVQGPSYIIGDMGGHFGMVSSIALITLYMCSMICGFFYRLVSLMDTFYYKLMMSWIGFSAAVVVHAVPTVVLAGMMHLSYVPASVVRDKTLARFPQLAPILGDEAIFGYDVEYNPVLVYFFIVVLALIFLIVPLIMCGCIFTILYKLRAMKSVMSAKTHKLHKNLLTALTVQILLPQFMILLPDVCIVFGAWKEWPHVNIIAETTLMLCTCHSVIDNFVMLLMITPYRKALVKIFGKTCGKYKININITARTTQIAQTSNTTPSTSRKQTVTSQIGHH